MKEETCKLICSKCKCDKQITKIFYKTDFVRGERLNKAYTEIYCKGCGSKVIYQPTEIVFGGDL